MVTCRSRFAVAVVPLETDDFELHLAAPDAPVPEPAPDAQRATLHCELPAGHHVDHRLTMETTEGTKSIEWPRDVAVNRSEFDR